MKVYNIIFDWYVSARSSDAGVEVVRKFTQNLQPGAKILDIGCGYGFPIANTLYQLGFKLYGIDSSIKMVTRFKEDLPDVPVQCSNILDSDFFNILFDAVIAYGFIFHLPQDQQTKVIEKVSEHLQYEGCFLFSSGDEDGTEMTPQGFNGGERFMTYSMSGSNYEKTLYKNGMILENHYIEKDFGGTIYIAKKLSINAN
ncbi:MAG: class I SAM-dependent methyltransferase [Desulfobacteraceae bacterium]|nr:class I SAM-dependent methyltransferase [Desulfobacteraceae bacterium]